jgi:tetratricopeptide (TPR) repeat protein
MKGYLMKKWMTGLTSVLFLFILLSQGTGQEEHDNPGELYDSSMALYYQGKCEKAIQGFLKIIRSAPASALVPYSQYMIGLCYLKTEKYEEAIQALTLYMKGYPEGDRIREAEKGIQIAKEKLKEKTSGSVLVSTPDIRKSLSVGKGVKRRICVQVSSLEGKNLGDVEKRVKELKKGGVDTMILRVFQNKGDQIHPFATAHREEGVYFKTEFAPVVDDILGSVAEIVHRNGLEIFAWITTRDACYGLDGYPEYRCKSYNFGTKKMEMGRGFNLFHPDVLKRLEGLFRDLGRYPIDGILFQDDLILRHNEDFSNEANKAFLRVFGYYPHPDLFYIHPYQSESGRYFVKRYTEYFWAWANWKNHWLMNVAKRLMGAARESNSNLKFGIDLYFETIINEFNGVTWFSQTLSRALENDFDYYAIMAYHRQVMKNKEIDLKEAMGLMAEVTRKAVDAVRDPNKVLMKVWILDWKSNEAVSYKLIPLKEIDEILTAFLNHGEVSLAFAPYIDPFPLQSLKGRWTKK